VIAISGMAVVMVVASSCSIENPAATTRGCRNLPPTLGNVASVGRRLVVRLEQLRIRMLNIVCVYANLLSFNTMHLAWPILNRLGRLGIGSNGQK
jgi:hypothetical protein